VEYGEVRVEEEVTETADDVNAWADLQLRFLELGLFRGVHPYLSSLYDTEFTVEENDEGETLARQSELRSSAGLMADISDVLPELRLGLFHQYDFAAEVGEQVLGVELTLVERAQLGVVKQAFDLEALYFFPGDEDTDEDLEMAINGRLSLAVPFFSRVDIETYVDTFLFRGKLPSNDEVGLSIILGVGLRYADVFRFPIR
jgi:hypothetical protein